MRHIIFEEADTYKVALLTKQSCFIKNQLEEYYTKPLNKLGVASSSIIGFNLLYNATGKAPASFVKAYIENLLPALHSLGVEYLYCTDSTYFKQLTKSSKADPHIGYVLPCKFKGYEDMKVVLGVNYQALIFKPELSNKLDMSISTLADALNGAYVELGSNIIHSSYYPETIQDIKDTLNSLHKYDELTYDIEGFGLGITEVGLGTIAFAWDQHNGVAFKCDYESIDPSVISDHYGVFHPNSEVRELVKDFLTTYKGTLTYHNATFDIRSLIYTLWMEDCLDTKGLLQGLEVLANRFHDTKIIAYLATNSTAGNELSLKTLAHEFAGNWAQSEISDIRKIEGSKLLEYNLVDCLSTWYVRNKFYPVMVKDKQEKLYKDLMLPSQKLITQIELTGMPMNEVGIITAEKELSKIQSDIETLLTNNSTIKLLNLMVQKDAQQKANAKLKVKQHPLSKFSDIEFNPNSGQQVAMLLHDQMGLPVLDRTPTKQPATGADTLAKLINHTDVPEYKEIINALITLSSVSKILTAFIPAFKKATYKGDGSIYLHGSFNLGGTVSGRLSSSKPNLQNLPAGSEWGTLIKKAFSAPKGWLMVGADFSSLEDRINALLTKDPNKLRVYTDGYDSHSLRAHAYFGNQMPLIRQVDPLKQLRTFKVLIDGQEHYLIEGDLVELPDGTQQKVEDVCL